MSILSSLVREFALPLVIRAGVAVSDGDKETTLRSALKDTFIGDRELTPEDDNLLSRQVEAFFAKDDSVARLVGKENEELAEAHLTEAAFHLSELFRLISANKLLS